MQLWVLMVQEKALYQTFYQEKKGMKLMEI